MTDSELKIPVNIEDEMQRSYMDYAMSVIIGRALPDVRDGLKPAHRRVLYGMRSMGLASNRGYRKCAKIVGEVMGNFHPHGDASILTPRSNNLALKRTLEWKGNNPLFLYYLNLPYKLPLIWNSRMVNLPRSKWTLI